MISIFSDIVVHFFEVFMNDFSVYRSSFEKCLHHLSLVLERCKENFGVELGKMSFHGEGDCLRARHFC